MSENEDIISSEQLDMMSSKGARVRDIIEGGFTELKPSYI